MKKTTKGEGKLNVLRGESAVVLNEHFAKTGKYVVSEFSEEEKNELDRDLAEVDQKPAETRGIEEGGDS